MIQGNPLQIWSAAVRIGNSSFGLILAKRAQWMLVFGLEFLALAGATAADPGVGTIQGIGMVPHDNSMVPRLLIQSELGRTISIEYADEAKAGGWRVFSNVVVTSTPHAVVDLSSVGVEKRFYRLALAAGPPPNPNPDRLVWIPPGKFTMGSPAGEQDRYEWEGPQRVVTLTKGFYMRKYEVTQEDYLAVMGSNPSYFVEGRVVAVFPPPPVPPPPIAGDLRRPVEWVSWNDAVAYCRKLTEQEGAAGRLPAGWEYRLPTEAQWEYACRAGTTTRFYYGDDPSYAELPNYAWYFPFSANITQAVGQKLPNAWGLYDMSGNIGEWCLDWYALYLGDDATDPQGPPSGTHNVVRGGNWYIRGIFSRSAYRSYTFPDYKDGTIGFRVVLVPGAP